MDISNMSVTELKALGFELMQSLDQTKQNLQLVNSEIQRKMNEEVQAQIAANEAGKDAGTPPPAEGDAGSDTTAAPAADTTAEAAPAKGKTPKKPKH